MQPSFHRACALPWPVTAHRPLIEPGEVHLWSANLSVDDERSRYFESYLSRREKLRAARFSTEQSRVRYIRSRSILKELLSMYTGDDPAHVRFDLGPLGKPFLAPMPDPPLHFNSTDTQDEALYAFCLSGELGVDIERNSRVVRHEEIARRKFASQEYRNYLECSENKRRAYFLSMWTRKEAYGKAIGVGIRYRLNSVDLADAKKSNRMPFQDPHGKLWEIVQITPSSHSTACVVTEGTGWRFRCFRLAENRPVPSSPLESSEH